MARARKPKLDLTKPDLTEWALRIGATQLSDGLDDTFSVETVAGALRFTAMDSWIACRFSDVARARAHFGKGDLLLNPHSGKWNWHAGTAPGAVAEMTAQFQAAVEAMLPDAQPTV